MAAFTRVHPRQHGIIRRKVNLLDLNGVEDGLVHLGGVLALLQFSSDRFVSIGTDTCRSLHAYEKGWQAVLSQKLQQLDNLIVATQLLAKSQRQRAGQ